MKKKNCSYEKEILNGLKSGSLDLSLKKHLSDCPVCAESLAIYNWMNNFREASLTGNPEIAEKKLPTAEALWQGVRRIPRPDAELEKKALMPLLFIRIFAYAAGIIVPLLLFLFYMPEIKGFIHSNPGTSSIIKSVSAILKMLVESFSFLLLPMAVCALTLIVFVFVTAFQPKKAGGTHS